MTRQSVIVVVTSIACELVSVSFARSSRRAETHLSAQEAAAATPLSSISDPQRTPSHAKRGEKVQAHGVTDKRASKYEARAWESLQNGTFGPELSEAEVRDPQWAPAMESRLRARFNRVTLRALHLNGLELSRLDCRQSTCLLEVTYPQELESIPGSYGLPPEATPLDTLIASTGPLAKGVGQGDLKSGKSRGERSSQKVLLVFSEDEIDPDAYPSWVSVEASRLRTLTKERYPSFGAFRDGRP